MRRIAAFLVLLLAIGLARSECIPLSPLSGQIFVAADSEETVGEDGRAFNAVDGDPQTAWVSRWQPDADPLPHWLRIDLGSPRVICGVTLTPRLQGPNGTIREYNISYSTDGANWFLLKYGEAWQTWTPTPVTVLWTPKTARYLRVQGVTEINGGPWTSLAELAILVENATPSPANGTISIRWNPVSHPNLAGYTVYWGTASGVYTSSVDIGQETRWVIRDLEPQTHYFVAVKARAVDGQRSPSYSNEVDNLPVSGPPPIPIVEGLEFE